jgi:hypothetical protein
VAILTLMVDCSPGLIFLKYHKDNFPYLLKFYQTLFQMSYLLIVILMYLIWLQMVRRETESIICIVSKYLQTQMLRSSYMQSDQWLEL